MVTVQSDAGHPTSRTPPPRERLAIPAPDHHRSQPVVHDDRIDSRPYSDQLYEGDKFVLPSIEGQEYQRTTPQNPFGAKPSRSNVNPSEEFPLSPLVRREDLSREFNIIDITNAEDHHDTKRRKTETLYPDANMHHRYEQIEPLNTKEIRYVPITSTHLDRLSGYRQYPLAHPVEQGRNAKIMQRGREPGPTQETRKQPTAPLFHDVPAPRPLEVLPHSDEIYHSSSGRTNSTVTPRLRPLLSVQPHSDVTPRRTSLVPPHYKERIPVRHDRVHTITPLEVIPSAHDLCDYRPIYASGQNHSSSRQHVTELEPARSVDTFNRPPDITRPLKYVQTPRYRELEQLPHEIVEYVQPDGTIKEYVSAGRSIPTYRRVPIEVGEGEHPRQTQEYMLSTGETSSPATPRTYRRYALGT